MNAPAVTKRDQIIESTCGLIERQGYTATGLNEILEHSGAPKGSLYYYFPDGKDELVEEAIQRTDRAIAQRLRAGMTAHDDPGTAVSGFIVTLAQYVQASGFQSGGPITAVALEAASTNERLNAACRAAYTNWQSIIEGKLRSSGVEPVRARRLAAVVIATIEGAIILSRTERNVGPLLDAATELQVLLSN